MPLSCGHLVCHACIHDLNTLMTHAHRVSLTGLHPPDLFALQTPWCLTCHPRCMPVAWEIATTTLDDKHTHTDLQHTRYPATHGGYSCPCIDDDLEMCRVWYTPIPRRRPPPFHLYGSHTLAHTQHSAGTSSAASPTHDTSTSTPRTASRGMRLAQRQNRPVERKHMSLSEEEPPPSLPPSPAHDESHDPTPSRGVQSMNTDAGGGAQRRRPTSTTNPTNLTDTEGQSSESAQSDRQRRNEARSRRNEQPPSTPSRQRAGSSSSHAQDHSEIDTTTHNTPSASTTSASSRD